MHVCTHSHSHAIIVTFDISLNVAEQQASNLFQSPLCVFGTASQVCFPSHHTHFWAFPSDRGRN